MKQYTAKSGLTLCKPSVEELQTMDSNDEGFCLACGHMQAGCEPDAAKYTCDACGENKVFGYAELAVRGLYY